MAINTASVRNVVLVASLVSVMACFGSSSNDHHHDFPLTTSVPLIGENNSIDNVNFTFAGESYGPSNQVGPTLSNERNSTFTRTWNDGSSVQNFTIKVGHSGTDITSVNVSMTGDERNSGLKFKATWDGTNLVVTHQ